MTTYKIQNNKDKKSKDSITLYYEDIVKLYNFFMNDEEITKIVLPIIK